MRYFYTCCIVILLGACNNDPQNVALGTLERDRIAHTATTNEIVVELPVETGTVVKKGTLLVQLDNTQQKAEVAKALAEVAQAKANLEKLQKGARKEEISAARANVAGAKATLVESKANYKRTRDLVKNKLSSQVNLDRATAARDSHLASLQNAQEQLQVLINGTRKEDLQIGQAHLNSMKATLAVQQKKLADLTITATRDGLLDNLPWNLGERVTSGSPVAVLLAGKAPFARVYVPEPYRVKLKINDQLIIHVDGVAEPLSGTLRWISNEPAFSPYFALNQQERSRLMYLAEVQLPDNAAHLPNGLPAQVELP